MATLRISKTYWFLLNDKAKRAKAVANGIDPNKPVEWTITNLKQRAVADELWFFQDPKHYGDTIKMPQLGGFEYEQD